MSFLSGWVAAIMPQWWSRNATWITLICIVFVLAFVAVVTSIQWSEPDSATNVVKPVEVEAPALAPAHIPVPFVTAPAVEVKVQEAPVAPPVKAPDPVPVEKPKPPPPPPPAPKGAGTIEVAVKPWGNVFLNGTRVGTAPPRVVLKNVLEGTHQIEIRNDSGARHSQTVRVIKGQTARVEHTFDREN